MVYFTPGRKYPKIVMNNYEYRMVKAESTPTKTMWLCTQERNKCKVRIRSSGNKIFVKNMNHTHPPTVSTHDKPLQSRVFNVVNG